jgi:hypothetical protein
LAKKIYRLSDNLLKVLPCVLEGLKPELGAEQAVDETVAGAVDDEEEVAEVADDQGPEWKRLLPGFRALQSLADHHHFVKTEKDSENKNNLEF